MYPYTVRITLERKGQRHTEDLRIEADTHQQALVRAIEHYASGVYTVLGVRWIVDAPAPLLLECGHTTDEVEAGHDWRSCLVHQITTVGEVC